MTAEVSFHNLAEAHIDHDLKSHIIDVIEGTDYKITTGCGDELRKIILNKLKKHGWSDDFKLAAHSQISLTSSKDNHVLCFQTGNMGRFYADLLKLQYVYLNEKARAAFYILPSKEAAKKIGSNIAHFDRLIFELELFKQIIKIPTVVIGIK